MKTNQPTIYGLTSLLYMLFGLTPTIGENETMNERLGVQPNARPTAGEAVRLGILCVGNRGHKFQAGNGGIGLPTPENHLGDHSSVFNPMPFCMRPVTDDLTGSERSRYALRREITGPDGQNYFAYYGFRLNITADDISVVRKKITTQGSTVIEEEFVAGQAQLYPEPQELSTGEAVIASNVRLSARCLLRVRLSAQDIGEYINVAKIMHGGDERYAIMSEFALCTGADRRFDVNSTHGVVSFNESIGTTIYTHSAEFKPLYYNNQELTLDFDVGNDIPLLSVESIQTLETL